MAEFDDAREIEALVATFFAAFSSGPDIDQRLEALRGACLPDARIVRTCGQPAESYDIDSFIGPRRRLLTDGTLTEFEEAATAGRIDMFGDIGHWFGRYTKSGLMKGAPYRGAGMKSIQCVRTAEGWRISAVAWDDDTQSV